VTVGREPRWRRRLRVRQPTSYGPPFGRCRSPPMPPRPRMPGWRPPSPRWRLQRRRP
jgi:hypothetical protein